MMLKNIFLLLTACLLLVSTAPGAALDPLWQTRLSGAGAGSPAFFSGRAIVATKDGTLIALDGAGKPAWKQKLPGGCLAAPAVDDNGDIYVACADGILVRFTAGGKEIWRAELGQEMLATPAAGPGRRCSRSAARAGFPRSAKKTASF